MTDQQNSGVVILVEPGQQANNLRLGGWLHGVSGFISNQQARLVSKRDGDHDLLTFAVGQLVGEAAHNIFVIFNSHPVQQFNSAALTPAKALPPVAFKGPAGDILHQLQPNTLGRIETGLRLLEDHRYVVANQFSALAVRETQQIDIIKTHTVGGDPPVIFGDAANRLGD